MGKIRGRAGARRLVDMASADGVEETAYVPPPREECDAEEFFVYLSDQQRLEVRLWRQRGQIVNFVLEQVVTEIGVDSVVARIDCCHGTLHRHVFGARGVDLMKGKAASVIESLGPDAAERMNQLYDECYDRLLQEWEANHRRRRKK